MIREAFIDILNSFLKERSFVKHQIDSYNYFVTRKVQKIVDEIETIKPDIPEVGSLKIKLRDVKFLSPRVVESDGIEREVLPFECRLRNLTYASPLYIGCDLWINDIKNEKEYVHFGDIPVMVKSVLCPLSKMSENELIANFEDPNDLGGYFIINGTERVMIVVEEISENKVIVDKADVGAIEEIARIHSEKDGYIQRHLLERRKDGTITITFANVVRLPLVVLLKALGLEDDKDIILTISLDEEVQEKFYLNLIESEVTDSKEAKNYLIKHLKITKSPEKYEKIEKLLDKYLLPHIGQDKSFRMEKAVFLCKAAEKLIKFHLGKTEKDDLDHYSNKRLRLAGDLLEILFRTIMLGKWGLITRINFNYVRSTKRGRLPPLKTVVEANVFTNQMISTMAIGAWPGNRSGVTQRLDRMSYFKSISHMRNIMSPLTSSQEHFEARELHPTHFGRICASETPEGANIGLRKYLALMSEVTFDLSKEEIDKIIENLPKYEKV
ncbi:MAG: DNA-directed RNA polymerase subunit B'' [Candidatus Aenigmarchaeota archaeon]|nr:DNA-directed RNA polymerase subunit B'' [Candidatus Aenigmarchaeota archaeon]MDW8149729.1 DNA-directed RNA polymerase subunit B'' [Candidatus Aenigmarchaeota archaeon]